MFGEKEGRKDGICESHCPKVAALFMRDATLRDPHNLLRLQLMEEVDVRGVACSELGGQ